MVNGDCLKKMNFFKKNIKHIYTAILWLLLFLAISLAIVLKNSNKRIKNLKATISKQQLVDIDDSTGIRTRNELVEILQGKDSFTDYNSPSLIDANTNINKNISINQEKLNAAGSQDKDWLLVNGNYSQNRFYIGSDINSSNVHELKKILTINTNVKAAMQSSPLVVDGIMYISTAFNNIYAYDAMTGKFFWHYRYKNINGSYFPYNCCGPNNRGLAIKDNKLISATLDGHLICLDAKSGKLLWKVDIVNLSNRFGYGAVAAPVIFENKVLIGCTGGDDSIRGFMKAFDINTGKKLWTFYTIPENGHEGTWENRDITGHDLKRNIEKEKKLLPLYKKNLNLGGAIWNSPSVDVNSRTIFFTTGNPYPDYDGDKRPGDNLYTESILAIDIDKGVYKWHMQYIPHDIWDLDFSPPTILLETHDNNGVPIKAVLASGKMGNIFMHNQLNGKVIKISEPMIYQDLWNKDNNPTGMTNLNSTNPDLLTGVSWSPMAYNPKYKFAYALNSVKKRSGAVYKYHGRFVAMDVDKGKIAWKIETEDPLVGAPLTTAGNLVFYGEGNGRINAVDAFSGKKLWNFTCDAGANGGIISYKIDNKQYIAIGCGGETIRNFKRGNKIFIFSL